MADPDGLDLRPATPPEAALERVPRLREILAAAHRAALKECNRSGEMNIMEVFSMEVFSEHVTQVMGLWTFTERSELEALAQEILMKISDYGLHGPELT